MTWKFPAANKLAVLLAALSAIAVGFAVTAANAEPKRQFDERGRAYYGPNGPNVSYQQGPRTRIYVSRRSWLDAGVEVLPSDLIASTRSMDPGVRRDDARWPAPPTRGAPATLSRSPRPSLSLRPPWCPRI